MTIDVSTLAIQVKSQGINESAQGLNKVFVEAGKAEKRVTTLTASIERLSQGFDKGAASAIAYQAAVAQANRQVDGHDAASKAMAQSMNALTGVLAKLVASFDALEIAQKRATPATRSHTAAMQDAHAMARGLAGSLGALWVTYGSLVPLAAGVAIGYSFKNIVKVGMEVENTLEGIRVKGGESMQSISAMRDAIGTLGQGIYGPQEIAKAFETLVLAGLPAEKAIVGIRDALNLATVGGTTIEKSAFTLVQVSTSLGYTAEGFGRVGDVIAKTAAVSMSSVESLSEAFKSAASVGKLYGASLVDIGTGLGALSQLGIQGSAAGTSLKNFYKELATESDKLKNTLSAMKMKPADLKDANGDFLDMVTVVGKLSDGLNNLSPAQQKIAMATMANERGMKTLVEVLDQYRKKTDDGTSSLKSFHDQIADSYAFTAIGAAQMALTTENQFKSVKNTLMTSFKDAFTAIEPTLLVFSSRLKDTFRSDTFKQSIETIAVSLASLALALAENIDKVVALVVAIGVFKTAMMVTGMVTALVTALGALKVAFIEGRIAAMAFQASLGIVGALLIAAGAAFAYYYAKKNGEDDKGKAALNNLTEFNKNLAEENTRMEKVNAQLALGKSLKDADTSATREGAIAMAEANKQAMIGSAYAKQTAAQQSLEALPKGSLTGHQFEQRLLATKALAQAQADIRAQTEAGTKLVEETKRNVAQAEALGKVTAAYQEKRIQADKEASRANAGAGNAYAKEDKGAKSINNEIKSLAKLEAAYDSKARTAAATAATEVKAAGDVEYSKVLAAEAEGQYAKASQATIDKLKEQAKETDLAKFALDTQIALGELSGKMTRKYALEKAALDDANTGHAKLTGTLQAEVLEMARLWNLDPSGEVVKRILAQAKAIDSMTEAQQRASKFNQGSESMLTDARGMLEAGDALVQFGKAGKETALQLAALRIAQESLDARTQAGVIGARNEAAVMIDLATSYKALATVANTLTDSNDKDQAAMVAEILTSEAEKVNAKRNTMLKSIEFSKAQADAAIAFAWTAGTVTKEQLDAYDKAIAAYGSAMKSLDEQTAMGLSKAAIKDMQTNLEVVKTLAGEMETSFGNVGKAIGGMVTAVVSLEAAQVKYNETLKQAGNEKDPAQAAKLQKQAATDMARAQVKSYADMAGAAKGFFKEGTTGYKVLGAAEKAFRVVEMAMAYEAMIRKIFFTETVTAVKVGALATETTANIASVGPNVAADGAKATASGIAAFAKTLASLPFPFNIAAGAAVLALLLGAGVSMMGGGGGGSSVPLSEQRQVSQGTGTVLGDSAAKSESITKALDILASNSNIALAFTSSMLQALHSIRDGISGMTTFIARSAGLRGTKADELSLGVGSSKSFLGFSSDSTELVDTGIVFDKVKTAAESLSQAAGEWVDVVNSMSDSSDGYTEKVWRAVMNNATSGGASQTVGSVLSNGVAAHGYSDLHSESSSFWGLFSDSSDESKLSGLRDDLKNQMALTIGSLYNGVIAAAQQFGKDKATLETTLQALDFTSLGLDKISLKGLTGADITKELEAAFGAAGDVMAQKAMPGLEAFQKAGEGYFETLIRVASGMDVATFTLDKLNITAVAYTDILNKQGDVATEIVRDSIVKAEKLSVVGASVTSGVGQIIDTFTGSADDMAAAYKTLVSVRDQMGATGLGSNLNRDVLRGAGGLDELSSGVAAYVDNFFTDAEKLKMSTDAVRKQFAALGMTMPATRDDFKTLITQTSALGTEAGDTLTGKLLSLADAFAKITEETTKSKTAEEERSAIAALNIRLADVQGNTTLSLALRRAEETATASEAEKAILLLIYSLEDAKTATEDARTALDSLNKVRTLQVQILQLEGKAAEATALQREVELSTTEAALIPLKLRVYALQDEAAATATTTKLATMYLEVLKLQGDTTQATILQRALELATTEAGLVQLRLRIYALQDEAAALSSLNKAYTLQINNLKLEGKTLEATTLSRQMELSATEDSLKPLKLRQYALEDEADALSLLNKANTLQVDILKLQGKDTESLALARSMELAATEDALKPMKLLQYALQDQASAADEAQKAIDKANAALSKATSVLDTAFNALKEAVSAEKDRLTKTYEAEVERIKKQTEANIEIAKKTLQPAQDSLKAIQSIFDKISEAIKSTTIESLALNSARRREAQGVLSHATAFSNSGGSLQGFTGLEDALTTIAKPSEDFFHSFEDYARDQAVTKLALESLGTNAKKEVDKAQLTIDAINGTIDAIQAASDAQLLALQTAHEADLARLDAIVASAQAQLDAVNGVTAASKTIAGASAEFASALTGVSQAQTAVARATQEATTSAAAHAALVAGAVLASADALTAVTEAATEASANSAATLAGALTAVANALNAFTAAQAATTPGAPNGANSVSAQIVAYALQHNSGASYENQLEFYNAAVAAGVTSAMVDAAFGFAPGTANDWAIAHGLPAFSQGADWLPTDMVGQLHEGERIIPKADNIELMRRLDGGSSSGNADVKQAIEDLKQAIKDGDVATVQTLKEILKIEKRWDTDGVPPERVLTT